MRKNKGLSLIELLAVVAILSIVATGVLVSVFSSSGWRAKKVVEALNQALSETRVQALSKSNAWMEINEKDGGYVIRTSYSSDVVLDGRFTITYHTAEDDQTYDAKTQPMILSYDRGSGAFSGVISSVTQSGDAVTYTMRYGDDGKTLLHCDQITVSQGSKTWIIKLYPETGKHSVEE